MRLPTSLPGAIRAIDPSLGLATIDFETRSAADIRLGSWKYSRHETTSVLCLAYHMPGEDAKTVSLFHRAHPEVGIERSELPADLIAHIEAGGLVEAHNSFFERCIWQNVLLREHPEFPKVDPAQWRCSAAKASAAGMPRSLEVLAQALELDEQKDTEGSKVMLKLAKTRRMLKKEIVQWMADQGMEGDPLDWRDERLPVLFVEDAEMHARNWEYCKQDVTTEVMASGSLPELSPMELLVWQIDQAVNERGVHMDSLMIKQAQSLIVLAKEELNEELLATTGIEKASRRRAIMEWLKDNENLELADTASATLEHVLGPRGPSMSDRARRVITIVREYNKTSTKKYDVAAKMVDSGDSRLRDMFMYHGAATGRWSGKGIQPQNLPRGEAKNAWDDKGNPYFNMDRACESIREGDYDWLKMESGDVLQLLVSSIRGLFTPTPGKKLLGADYSSIESRVILWLAGDTRALDLFRAGGDIYCDMASSIYGYEVSKKTHPEERQFGKAAILGLGFGMGAITFLTTCRNSGITFTRDKIREIIGSDLREYVDKAKFALGIDLSPTMNPDKLKAAKSQATKNRRKLVDNRINPQQAVGELALMQYAVDKYRSKYSATREMWADVEKAAGDAVSSPGQVFVGGRCKWYMEDKWLISELPSGRKMRYFGAQAKMAVNDWGQKRKSLKYMTTAMGKFVPTGTYGGKLVENITQATARDLLAAALIRVTATDLPGDKMSLEDNKLWKALAGGVANPYRVVLHVHDEIVCEVDENRCDVKEFETLMCEPLAGFETLPVAAEGDLMNRFQK